MIFALASASFDFCRGPIAVDLNYGFSKGLQRRFKFGGFPDGDGFLEMGLHVFRQLCPVDEEFGFALLFQNGVGEDDRRVGHVMAPDVEDPGDRVGLGEHGCVGSGLGEEFGNHRQFFGNTLAGELQGLNREGGGGPLGLVLPDRIDGVAGKRLQLGARLGAGRCEALGLIGGQQPWVVTQDIALFQVFGNPGGGRLIDQMVGREKLGVHLLAHLDGVAAVNEDGPLVKGEDGHAPGTGKTGKPAQALGIGCHIFTLKFILPGNDQPAKFLFPEQQPKCVHARFVSHFRSLIRCRDSGKRKYLHPASTCSISSRSKTWAGRLAAPPPVRVARTQGLLQQSTTWVFMRCFCISSRPHDNPTEGRSHEYGYCKVV